MYFRLNLHFSFSGFKMYLNYKDCAHEKWNDCLRSGLICCFLFMWALKATRGWFSEVKLNTSHSTHQKNDICVLLLRVFNLFTASRLHPKAVPHIYHLTDCRAEASVRLILDLCVIKQLFEKISHGILQRNKHTPFLKRVHSEMTLFFFLINLEKKKQNRSLRNDRICH